jgi:hypothetical protein
MRVLVNSYVDVSLAKPKGECIEAVLYHQFPDTPERPS